MFSRYRIRQIVVQVSWFHKTIKILYSATLSQLQCQKQLITLSKKLFFKLQKRTLTAQVAKKSTMLESMKKRSPIRLPGSQSPTLVQPKSRLDLGQRSTIWCRNLIQKAQKIAIWQLLAHEFALKLSFKLIYWTQARRWSPKTSFSSKLRSILSAILWTNNLFRKKVQLFFRGYTLHWI